MSISDFDSYIFWESKRTIIISNGEEQVAVCFLQLLIKSLGRKIKIGYKHHLSEVKQYVFIGQTFEDLVSFFSCHLEFKHTLLLLLLSIFPLYF